MIDWIYDRLYKLYKVREVRGVRIYCYWRLRCIKVGKGLIRIPIRLWREDDRLQIELVSSAYRLAFSKKAKKGI